VTLGAGVELGGVGVPVVWSVGEAVALPGCGDGEAAGLPPGDGLEDGEDAGLVVAVEDEAGETVRLGAGDGLELPAGGASRVADDVGVPAVRVFDGSKSGGV